MYAENQIVRLKNWYTLGKIQIIRELHRENDKSKRYRVVFLSWKTERKHRNDGFRRRGQLMLKICAKHLRLIEAYEPQDEAEAECEAYEAEHE